MRTLVSPVALPYLARIKNHFGSALVAYYPLDETAGTTAYDRSGHGYNGVYTSPTLSQYSGLGLKPRCGFDGSLTVVNITDVNFLAALNQSEGAIAIQLCPSTADLWTSASTYYFVHIGGTNNFYVRGNHSSTNRNIAFEVKQNNVSKFTGRNNANGGTGWVSSVINWSATGNEVSQMRNGVKIATATPTACSGVVNVAKIGASISGGKWPGGIGSVMFFNRPLTEAEAKFIATETDIERIAIIGDSISTDVLNLYWMSDFARGYHNGQNELIGHGGGGGGVLQNEPYVMAYQVANALNDDATRVIITIGGNDNENGDMAVFKAEIIEQVGILRRANPRAVLYWMNILPQWTNNTTGPEYDHKLLRPTIAEACAELGITCWDTYTDPWITQSQTQDGLHPTATPWAGSGHEAIAARVAELLT